MASIYFPIFRIKEHLASLRDYALKNKTPALKSNFFVITPKSLIHGPRPYKKKLIREIFTNFLKQEEKLGKARLRVYI